MTRIRFSAAPVLCAAIAMTVTAHAAGNDAKGRPAYKAGVNVDIAFGAAPVKEVSAP